MGAHKTDSNRLVQNGFFEPLGPIHLFTTWLKSKSSSGGLLTDYKGCIINYHQGGGLLISGGGGRRFQTPSDRGVIDSTPPHRFRTPSDRGSHSFPIDTLPLISGPLLVIINDTPLSPIVHVLATWFKAWQTKRAWHELGWVDSLSNSVLAFNWRSKSLLSILAKFHARQQLLLPLFIFLRKYYDSRLRRSEVTIILSIYANQRSAVYI